MLLAGITATLRTQLLVDDGGTHPLVPACHLSLSCARSGNEKTFCFIIYFILHWNSFKLFFSFIRILCTAPNGGPLATKVSNDKNKININTTAPIAVLKKNNAMHENLLFFFRKRRTH